MSRASIFWLLMILWLIFGFVISWPTATLGATGYAVYAPLGGHLLSFVLFALVGWQVFGPPIKN